MKSLTDSTRKGASRVAWSPWMVLWLPMDWSRKASVRQKDGEGDTSDMTWLGLVAEVGRQAQALVFMVGRGEGTPKNDFWMFS